MSSQRLVICMFIIMLVTLSGCYRPAEGEFQPVDSQQGAPVQPVVESPTPTVIIIVPDASATPADAQIAEETTEPSIPFDPVVSPTLIIIEPPLTTPTDAFSGQVLVTPSPTPQAFVPLATATSIGIITPQAPSAVEFPTFTLEPSATPAESLASTPAAPNDTTTSTACTYTVRSGDNLFRIALNNNVNLDELRAANGIVGDLIQPGQVLTLPGCQAPAIGEGDAPAPSASGRTHTVQAGETLGSIARLYGVSIADLQAANNLANPNLLSIGQVLIIPDAP